MKGKVANTPQSLVCDLRGSFACFHLIRKRQKSSAYFYF